MCRFLEHVRQIHFDRGFCRTTKTNFAEMDRPLSIAIRTESLDGTPDPPRLRARARYQLCRQETTELRSTACGNFFVFGIELAIHFDRRPMVTIQKHG